jgi:hypothetical protein
VLGQRRIRIAAPALATPVLTATLSVVCSIIPMFSVTIIAASLYQIALVAARF